MVGGQRRGEGERLRAVGVDEVEHGTVDERSHDHPTVRAVGVSGAGGEQPAHDRRDARQARPRPLFRRHDRWGARARRLRGGAIEVCLRAGDHVDHGLVGRARRVAPCEHAVPQQHHGARAGVRIVRIGGGREVETRHGVLEEDDVVAERVAHTARALGLVGEREDRVRVRVIEEAHRNERVHQGLDRRRRRPMIEEMRAELVHHCRFREGAERAQAAHVREVEPGKALGLDDAEIVTRCLDENRRHAIAEDGRVLALRRRVAAAVEHEVRLTADEPARVHAEREVLADARAIARDAHCRIVVGPRALHARARPRVRALPRAAPAASRA